MFQTSPSGTPQLRSCKMVHQPKAKAKQRMEHLQAFLKVWLGH